MFCFREGWLTNSLQIKWLICCLVYLIQVWVTFCSSVLVPDTQEHFEFGSLFFFLMLDLNIVDDFDTARFIKCLKPSVNKGSLSSAGFPVQPRNQYYLNQSTKAVCCGVRRCSLHGVILLSSGLLILVLLSQQLCPWFFSTSSIPVFVG